MKNTCVSFLVLDPVTPLCLKHMLQKGLVLVYKVKG